MTNTRTIVPDTSFWEGDVDFQKMRTKTPAVIIKASQQVVDSQFKRSWTNAKAAGLLRGAYHYLDFRHDTMEQAILFTSLLAEDPGELPPILDLEMNPALALNLSIEQEGGPRPYSLIHPYGGGSIKEYKSGNLSISNIDVQSRVALFLGTVEQKLGVVPMIYSGYYYWGSYMTTDPKWTKYPFWLAWYANESIIKVPAPWVKWTLWQYIDSGPGHDYGAASAEIDLSWFPGDEAALRAFAKTPTSVIPTHPDICPTCHQRWPQIVPPDPANKDYEVNVAMLNVRSQASQTSQIVRVALRGEVLHMLSEEVYNGYMPIADKTWVWSSYVTKKV